MRFFRLMQDNDVYIYNIIHGQIYFTKPYPYIGKFELSRYDREQDLLNVLKNIGWEEYDGAYYL